VWFEIDPNSVFWESVITGVRFGETNAEKFKIDEIRFVLDSSSPYIAFPVSIYETMIKKLFQKRDITIDFDTKGISNGKVDC